MALRFFVLVENRCSGLAKTDIMKVVNELLTSNDFDNVSALVFMNVSEPMIQLTISYSVFRVTRRSKAGPCHCFGHVYPAVAACLCTGEQVILILRKDWFRVLPHKP